MLLEILRQAGGRSSLARGRAQSPLPGPDELSFWEAVFLQTFTGGNFQSGSEHGAVLKAAWAWR
eukprot:4486299-Lingulodinium_polyedra.AAC.1